MASHQYINQSTGGLEALAGGWGTAISILFSPHRLKPLVRGPAEAFSPGTG